ncbi:MAG TPA: hypothetical protein VNZ52_13950 [Candidatus Thermoplasmatota archaeon]|nr:hypothetical protein [Candidatus Thermoplasmatota archaeon]
MDLIPPLESHLLDPVARHFADQGYAVAAEMYYNHRLADVVAVKDGRVIAVELKLRAWKGALKQATAYQVTAHESYVALPLVVALPLLRRPSHFLKEGVGLLGVNHPHGDVRCLIPAGENKRLLPFAAERIRLAIEALMAEEPAEAAPQV